MHKRSLLVLSVGLILILLSACNYPRETAVPTEPMDIIRTAAAQTVEAMTTQIAATNPISNLPTATVEVISSETPAPTQTQQPAFTPTPTAICDRAGFIEETLPDGSDFLPGSTFTKTWKIKNTGTCSWDANYAVVFTGGDAALNAPASLPITTGNVAPGETVLISMNLTAPSSVGTYKAEFKLRNASNVIFGTGDYNKAFWIQIDVVSGSLDLAKNMCAAEWSTASGILDCPGKDGDSDGYAYLDETPLLEHGGEDDEPAIWTAPEKTTNGYIRAIFPAQKMPAGMKFYSVIGCAPSETSCDAKLSLNYREPGGALVNLATWHEVNDGTINRVTYDLGALAGKNVQIILIVDANGSASGDKIHWLLPGIEP